MKLKRHTIWPFALVFAMYAASCQPSLATPKVGFTYDKLAHFLVFGLLATSILRIPYFFNKRWKGLWLTVFIVTGYGILDEFRQFLTGGRSVELNDWIADTFGAILASVLYLKYHWYRQILEVSCFNNKKKQGATTNTSRCNRKESL